MAFLFHVSKQTRTLLLRGAHLCKLHHRRRTATEIITAFVEELAPTALLSVDTCFYARQHPGGD